MRTGVQRSRVELVREDNSETALVLQTYRRLLDGEIDARTAVSRVSALEKYGVTGGTLTAASNTSRRTLPVLEAR